MVMTQVGDSLTMPINENLADSGDWKLCMNIDRPEGFVHGAADAPELILSLVRYLLYIGKQAKLYKLYYII